MRPILYLCVYLPFANNYFLKLTLRHMLQRQQPINTIYNTYFEAVRLKKQSCTEN